MEIKQCIDEITKLNISKQKLIEYKEAFQLFDKDGDGHITTEELATIMGAVGGQNDNDQIMKMIEQVDINGDGLVQFEEFVEMMQNHVMDPELEMRETFRVFDKDNNGFIDAEELRMVLRNMGYELTDKEIEEMLAEADKDGDSRITFEEFCEMLKDNGTENDDPTIETNNQNEETKDPNIDTNDPNNETNDLICENDDN